MVVSTDGFRIPVTLQLDAHTFRAIHAAAKRTSESVGHEVTVRELIETRLAEAVTGVGRPNQVHGPKQSRGNRLSPEARDRLFAMNDAGATAAEIAEAIGCHTATVAYHRNKIRAEKARGTSNV